VGGGEEMSFSMRDMRDGGGVAYTTYIFMSSTMGQIFTP